MESTPEKKIWEAGTLRYTTAGIVVLFFWLLWGDFAWGLKERSVGFVAALMVKSFGISDLTYGIMMVSFPCFTNIFLMPIISYWSDRHRGRLGRRIPFLLATTPFVVIGLVGLGFTPMLGSYLQETIGTEAISLNMARLLVFALFWVILDFGTTLTNAIFVALANDVVPSPLIGRFLALFRMVSLCCAVLFNGLLLGYAESHSLYIFVGLGLFYGFGLYLMCGMVKEGQYPPPAEDQPDRHPGVISAAKTYFRECFSLPYYRWVIIAQVCCAQSVLPVNMYAIFYAKKLGVTMDMYGKLTAGIFLFAVVMSFILGTLSDKFHPIRTGMVSIGLLVLVQLAGGFLIHDQLSFMIVFTTHEVVIMSFNTLMASYAQRLFPKAYFAQFNSALQMIMAISAVALAPVFGFILDRLGNNYAYIYLMGGIIGACGFASLLMVYRGFKQLGGDQNYVAPMAAPAAK